MMLIVIAGGIYDDDDDSAIGRISLPLAVLAGEAGADVTEMISFGAGVNSVAMVIMLVKRGWRGPIVFVDVGNEKPETYCYIHYFDRWLAQYDLSITILSPVTHPELYDASN